MSCNLIFTHNVAQSISDFVSKNAPKQVFVHCDTNTAKFVMPILDSQSDIIRTAKKIISESGENNKNFESLKEVWNELSVSNATRTDLFINVGGGMVSDLGGFAAATFKRGMRVLNIPTTLLSAVDASVGGKTAINFNGYKNHIGAFYEPDATIISTVFFQTLPQFEMLSGYAEMIKHALLKDFRTFDDVLSYDITLPPVDPDRLLELIKENVLIKKEYVDADPTEKGIRKVLNYGHTVAHALESFAGNNRKNSISHGFAVAQGLVVETVLSNMIKSFPSTELNKFAAYIKENYGPYEIGCNDYPALVDYMRQDKKNESSDGILFTLLETPGKPSMNNPVSEKDICAAFDIYRDLMGI